MPADDHELAWGVPLDVSGGQHSKKRVDKCAVDNGISSAACALKVAEGWAKFFSPVKIKFDRCGSVVVEDVFPAAVLQSLRATALKKLPLGTAEAASGSKYRLPGLRGEKRHEASVSFLASSNATCAGVACASERIWPRVRRKAALLARASGQHL
jgi:hypothetical protein